MKVGSRCWAHFLSEVDNGRDLFRRENYPEVRNLASGLDCRTKGGAFSKALGILWSKAEQGEYNERSRTEVDIDQ